MKQKCLLLLLPAVCFFLVSATSISAIETKVFGDTIVKATTHLVPHVQHKKSGFLQKWAFKILNKKINKHHYKADDPTKADKLATTSFWTGIAALVFVFIPWYIIFLSIPLGIIAIITGSNAKKRGTTKRTRASVGQGFGIAALALFVIFFIAALIIVAAWSSAWG